jgi:hypothetical protein
MCLSNRLDVCFTQSQIRVTSLKPQAAAAGPCITETVALLLRASCCKCHPHPQKEAVYDPASSPW